MTEWIDISLERLTASKFAPYGWLLEASGAPSFSRPNLANWRLPFHSDAALRLQIMRYARQPMRLSLVERHIAVTEARSPVGFAPAVLVVAGDPLKQNAPHPSSVRAFFLDGQTGVMFREGIWHGLDCFPAKGTHVDYLFLSDTATEDEIEAHADARHGVRTHLHDFAVQDGVGFQVTDPHGIMAE